MNAPDMRIVNGIQLLNLIREQGPVSRAELAKLSGLSKPTVSEQVGRLLSVGLAVETGQGQAGEAGGKRPTLVKFNAAAGRVAGISVGAEVTRIAVADLDGKLQRTTEFATLAREGADILLVRIAQALTTLLRGGGPRLRAIGAGVPGRVDCGTGVVLESGSVFGWQNVDLGYPLAKRFGCPVRIDNDANVALTAELHSGAASEAHTAVLIRAETGIGSAVAIGRRIHHGANWAAGEIGHLAAQASAGQVSPRGELESVLGADEIALRVRETAKNSAVLRKHLREHGEVPALFRAADEDDAAAREVARNIAHHASLAVANQALAYDPDLVLLSGGIFGFVLPEIEKFLSRTVPWSLNLQMAEFGEEGVLVGAVDTALLIAYEQLARELSTEEAPEQAPAPARASR